jgi:hypothetical protein
MMLSQGEEGNEHITHSIEGGNGDPHEQKQQPLQSRVRSSQAQPPDSSNDSPSP